jgi:hypothetical protein
LFQTPSPLSLSLSLSLFGRRKEGRGGRVCCFMLGVSQLLQWVIDLVEGVSRWWPAAAKHHQCVIQTPKENCSKTLALGGLCCFTGQVSILNSDLNAKSSPPDHLQHHHHHHALYNSQSVMPKLSKPLFIFVQIKAG